MRTKGKLSPPVHGNVISLFKEKGQNGIEIKAPLGTEVRAVLPGKVLYADWFKGFGNVMIIDHGDQTFTVSGYCSQLLKKAGDLVSQGEAIALVGSAGSLKGPCLYFEIRHKGKPQDPMEWISHLGQSRLPPRRERKRKEKDHIKEDSMSHQKRFWNFKIILLSISHLSRRGHDRLEPVRKDSHPILQYL